MIKDLSVTDIHIMPEFIKDYESAPQDIRKAVDKIIKMIGTYGIVPKSMHAHKAAAVDDEMWIGYVSRTKSHWRVIFNVDESVLYFNRLLKHEEMNVYLRTWV